MAGERKFVIIPSQYENDIFYVRTGDGKSSDQDVARVLVIQVSGIGEGQRLAIQDFVEELFKPAIPAWVR